MIYLTTHSTHFILRLYGVGHMIKDNSDSERGNPLPSHGLLFPINSKGSFICTIPQTGYHIPRPLLHLCYVAGTRNSSMGPPHEGSIRRPIAPWANALTTELHLAPNIFKWKQTSILYNVILFLMNHGVCVSGGGGGVTRCMSDIW